MKLNNSRIALLLVFCWHVLSLWSNPIDVERARKLALQSGLLPSLSAHTKTILPKGKRLAQTQEELRLVYTLNSSEHNTSTPLLYVFSPPSQKGYIVIAGDDAVEPVVGYSPNSSFNDAEMPPQLKTFLYALGQQVAEAGQQTANAPALATATATAQKAPIKPLLNNINWGQDMPYNTKTPQINGNPTPTGCVATALAQIMYYHRHPLRAQGSAYYNFKNFFKPGKTLVLGSEGDYQWEKMRPYYATSSTITQEEKDAVGLLLAEVGAGCTMRYDTEESSSTGANALKALHQHFDYPTAQLIRRMNMTAEAWDSLLYQELAERRPVYLDGIAAELGHAFVCDGYENGFYHINWGWDGRANGYFKFSYLSPQTRGVGGDGKGAYVVDLQAIVGIAPPGAVTHPQPTHLLLAKALRKSASYSDFNPTVDIKGVRLEGYETIEMDFSLGIKQDGRLLAVGAPSAWRIQKDYTYNKIEVRLMPEAVPEGSFTLLPIFSPRGKNEWQVIPVGRYFEEEVKVRKQGNKLTVEERHTPVSLSSTIDKTFVFAGKSNALKIQLTNNGTAAYSSFVSVHFGAQAVTGTVDKAEVKERTISIHLEPGETQEFVAEYTPVANANEAFVSVTYDPTNGLSEEPTIIPNTVLNSSRIAVRDANLYEGKLKAELKDSVYRLRKNTPLRAVLRTVSQATGAYMGSFAHLQLFVFSKDGLDITHRFKEFEVFLEKDEEKEYEAGGELYIEEGEYQLVLTNNKRDGRNINYEHLSKSKLIVLPALAEDDPTTGLSAITPEGITIVPYIKQGVLYLHSEARIGAIHLYNLAGIRVASGTASSTLNLSHLPKGVYLVKAETDQGAVTTKVVKAQ